MMSNNEISSQDIHSDFILPSRRDPLLDYEFGGVAIGDVSQGLKAKLWTCIYEDNKIKVGYDNNFQTLLTVQGVTALSLAFDINMRPLVTYIVNSKCHLWWYDSSAASQVTTDFGSNIQFPQLSLDDNRQPQTANADVIFAYLKNSHLYMRIQRERFQIEHKLAQAKRLVQIGMMANLRFGFAIYNWS